MKEYDLIVIGSGAGLTVLNEALEQGLRCALIESGKIGGTCLTRGCIPSKILTSAADAVRAAERARKIGMSFRLEGVDWNVIASRMWSQIDTGKEIAAQLSRIKTLALFRGTGEFTGRHQMRVRLPDGAYTEEFRGKRILIASGSSPVVPPIDGIESAGYVTTDSFFGDRFPAKPWKSVILVGGGFVAAEFAHIFSAFGTRVTIVAKHSRLLPKEEPEIGDLIGRVFGRRMTVLTGHLPVAARADGRAKYITVMDTSSQATREIEADELFICAGRRSNADALRAGECGIAVDKKNRWVQTNQFLETSVPNIWAIGDANGLYPFRHKANREADVCIRNMFGLPEEKTAVDYSAVPWAVYTDPTVGHVGLTEDEAVRAGRRVYRAIKHYSAVAKGFALGYDTGEEDDGFAKIILDSSLRILGAHVVGPHADLLVQPFVYLMNAGYTCAVREKGRSKSRGADRRDKTRFNYACPGAGTVMPLFDSMVIHPSLNEVTGWALDALEPVNIMQSEERL